MMQNKFRKKEVAVSCYYLKVTQYNDAFKF